MATSENADIHEAADFGMSPVNPESKSAYRERMVRAALLRHALAGQPAHPKDVALKAQIKIKGRTGRGFDIQAHFTDTCIAAQGWRVKAGAFGTIGCIEETHMSQSLFFIS